ncbi:MAG: hypothetical protein RLZ44_134 [Pseudomonadota bacterium]
MHPLDRVNVLLAGLVLALGLWLWLDRPGPPAPPLTALDPAAVTELRLYQGPNLLWSAQRAADGWTLTHPDAAPANAERVDQLLGVLRTPSLTQFPAPAALQSYGLAPPAYRLVCDGVELAFGATEPTTGLRYLLVDDQVHLIGDGFHHHLLAGAAGFRAASD